MNKLSFPAVFFIFFILVGTGSAQNKKSANVVDLLPTNYVKDASKDYTDIIQHIIQEYDNIFFPDFPILVNDKGLKIGSNKTLMFHPKGGIILAPSKKGSYEILLIKNSENVIVQNATIIGDKDSHLGNKGEWGMGIKIEGSNNVRIEQANISQCWGDGVYISKGVRNSKNIEIIDSEIFSNRRNGVSIISGENILIKNTTFNQINGTLPMAAIDIEPNNIGDVLGKILINNVKTSNSNIGLQIGLRNYPSENNRNIDIQIRNFTSDNDNHGLLIGDLFRKSKYGSKIKPLNGIIDVRSITINKANKEPIKYYSVYGYDYSPKVVFNDIKIDRNLHKSKVSKIKNDLNKRGFDTKAF